MKKTLSIILKVLPVVIMIAIIAMPTVLGAITTSVPGSSTGIGKIDTAATKIWTTVQTVVQILAFAAIVFAGVRYMFASADAKADIKKQTVILIVGALLVFAAGPIITWVVATFNQVIT